MMSWKFSFNFHEIHDPVKSLWIIQVFCKENGELLWQSKKQKRKKKNQDFAYRVLIQRVEPMEKKNGVLASVD